MKAHKMEKVIFQVLSTKSKLKVIDRKLSTNFLSLEMA